MQEFCFELLIRDYLARGSLALVRGLLDIIPFVYLHLIFVTIQFEILNLKWIFVPADAKFNIRHRKVQV